MCWSKLKVLVSMLFSAAGEWWIDMIEQKSSSGMTERQKESTSERSITLTLNANAVPRWIASNPHFLHGHAGAGFRDFPIFRGAVPPCLSLKEFS